MRFSAPRRTVSPINISRLEEEPNLVIKNELRDVFKIKEPGRYKIVVTFPDGDDEDLVNDVKVYSVTGHLDHEETTIVQKVVTERLQVPEIPVDSEPDVVRVELFPYVIAVLILLLIIEWGVYYREQY